jgi:hypothetical protein
MCLHYCRGTCVVAAVLGGCLVECTLLSGFVLSLQVLNCAFVSPVVHCVKGLLQASWHQQFGLHAWWLHVMVLDAETKAGVMPYVVIMTLPTCRVYDRSPCSCGCSSTVWHAHWCVHLRGLHFAVSAQVDCQLAC